MDLPSELIEFHILPYADPVTLFRLSATNTSMRTMVLRHMKPHVKAHSEVVASFRVLKTITTRDRSGRFRFAFDSVFYRWFFGTRLDAHVRWCEDDPDNALLAHPRPRGHKGHWCGVCGGTRGCKHHP